MGCTVPKYGCTPGRSFHTLSAETSRVGGSQNHARVTDSAPVNSPTHARACLASNLAPPWEHPMAVKQMSIMILTTVGSVAINVLMAPSAAKVPALHRV
jgi:hypothetical protein